MLGLLRLFGARRPPGRLLLSAAGIALGVALGYGVHLVNRAAVRDVAAAVRSVAGEADLEVRGGRGGLTGNSVTDMVSTQNKTNGRSIFTRISLIHTSRKPKSHPPV